MRPDFGQNGSGEQKRIWRWESGNSLGIFTQNKGFRACNTIFAVQNYITNSIMHYKWVTEIGTPDFPCIYPTKRLSLHFSIKIPMLSLAAIWMHLNSPSDASRWFCWLGNWDADCLWAAFFSWRDNGLSLYGQSALSAEQLFWAQTNTHCLRAVVRNCLSC